MTGHSRVAATIAHAIRWVNETFVPRSASAALSALRFASRVSTARFRNEVAVGTDRLSFIASASIAAGPRSGFASAAPAAAAPPSAAASTSALTIFPPTPVPLTAPRSTPAAAATRRATGDTGAPSPGGAAAVAGGVGSDAAVGAAPAPALISPSAWPTWTVSSAATSSFVIVPLAGAGTSASTLSVETSTTVSPSATCWPSATRHSSTVPSVTDSPISGIGITTVWPSGPDPCSPGPCADPAAPGREAEEGAGTSGVPEPLGSIRASTWPTVTVSSGAARILVTTPLAGAGTSASTLSVETSTTVSPSATCWPSATRHSRIVPSVTDSPIWGIWTSITAVSVTSPRVYEVADRVAGAAAHRRRSQTR